MDILTKLAIKYKTDKWGKHHYTPIYHDLFKDKKESVKKVIEIGVAEGAGVRMFRDYFPNAMIYGAELEEERLFEEDRIKVVKCNQWLLDDLVRLVEVTGKDVDLVVDDGSHVPEDQVASCIALMSMLDKDVTYIIEDVADVGIMGKLSKFDLELVVCGERYDDRLLIVRHKNE